jgi:hypothetical protein
MPISNKYIYKNKYHGKAKRQNKCGGGSRLRGPEDARSDLREAKMKRWRRRQIIKNRHFHKEGHGY